MSVHVSLPVAEELVRRQLPAGHRFAYVPGTDQPFQIKLRRNIQVLGADGEQTKAVETVIASGKTILEALGAAQVKTDDRSLAGVRCDFKPYRLS